MWLCSYAFLFVNNSYISLLATEMYMRNIYNKKCQNSYYDFHTFPLFYDKFASEKADILFPKYAIIVILESFSNFSSCANQGSEHFLYCIILYYIVFLSHKKQRSRNFEKLSFNRSCRITAYSLRRY